MTAVHVAEPHNENDQQRQHAEQSASAESVSHVLTPSFGRASKLTPAVVLHLQQTIGNRAVQRLIASYRAKKTTVRREEDENASPGAGAAATGGTGQLASL